MTSLLTNERAKAALAKMIVASSEFAKSLQQPEGIGEEDDEELNEGNPSEVAYDEIDSSRMMNKEVETLILQKPAGQTKDQPGSDSEIYIQ